MAEGVGAGGRRQPLCRWSGGLWAQLLFGFPNWRAVVCLGTFGGSASYVRDAVAQACHGHGVDVRIQPLISEYEYEYAEVYRRNRISRFVRYVVTISPAPRGVIRLLLGRDLRSACYLARSEAVRAAASLSRPQRALIRSRPRTAAMDVE